MTLISDQDKGLLEAEEVLGTLVIRAHCCWHLKENFKEKFGRGLVSAFWKAARLRTAILFEAALDEIAKVKPAAAQYLCDSDPTLWAEAYFPGRQYSHDTSNIAESLNKLLKFDRELAIVDLLDAIWYRVMEYRAFRLAEALAMTAKGAQYTPFVAAHVNEGRKWAQSNRVSLSISFFKFLCGVYSSYFSKDEIYHSLSHLLKTIYYATIIYYTAIIYYAAIIN